MVFSRNRPFGLRGNETRRAHGGGQETRSGETESHELPAGSSLEEESKPPPEATEDD
jgi:hypothetical protein